MARSIIVHGPSGLAAPSIRLVNSSDDSIEETITLTENTNGDGRYTGTIDAGTAAGIYVGTALSGSTAVGIFEEIEVSVNDPSTTVVRTRKNTKLLGATKAIKAMLDGIGITVTSP